MHALRGAPSGAGGGRLPGRLHAATLGVARCAVVLVSLACACGDAPPSETPPPEEALPAAQSHARMLEVLADIATRTKSENMWLRTDELERLRDAYAALADNAPLGERATIAVRLGWHETRAGDVGFGVERLEEAVAFMREVTADFDGPIDPRLMKALKTLGLAQIRLAETRNCVERHTSESCLLPIEGSGIHIDLAPARGAIATFREVLQHEPDNVGIRWIMTVAHMALGEYPEKVAEERLVPPEAFFSDEEFPRFAEIAEEVGVGSFSLAGGSVVDDLDGDGLLDVLVSSWDPRVQMEFFRNAGDGSFEDRTDAAGLTGILGGLNMLQADFDNDGDLDVLVLRGGWLGKGGRHPNSLLRNEGDGTFIDVAYAAGIAGQDYPTQNAAWGDYDNDGHLDLFVGNETTPGQWSPDQLFHSRGDGTFEQVAGTAGVMGFEFTKGCSWGDIDGDGWIDLYVSNLLAGNHLYRNAGNGGFADITDSAGVSDPERSFPVWFWDMDNDGALDLFVGGYGCDWQESAAGPVVREYLGLPTTAEVSRLYKGDGRGGFRNVTAAMGLDRPLLPMAANFGDLDNDGYLDFYLGTGEPMISTIVPNVMFRNRSGQSFADVTTAGGFGHVQKGHGIAFADLDQDGDVDVFARMGGAYPTDAFVDLLFQNPGQGGRSITLRLVGTQTNRAAIGARIKLEIEHAGERRAVYRWVNSGGSFGCNPLRQTIGVGAAAQTVTAEIMWPVSKTTQRFEGLAVGKYYELTEGTDTPRELPYEPLPFGR